MDQRHFFILFMQYEYERKRFFVYFLSCKITSECKAIVVLFAFWTNLLYATIHSYNFQYILLSLRRQIVLLSVTVFVIVH